MGKTRLFWPQETMDEWTIDETAIIKDDVLEIIGESTLYNIKQAVHFVADVGNGTDPHKLVGRVKELEVIIEMGAEHYMDSVLLEDTAYQVTNGFTGTPLINIDSQNKGGDISGAVATQSGDDKIEDRELLAKFLLDNL